MTATDWPNWMVFLPCLVGMVALAVISPEPDDKGGPDLDDVLALFATLPWV